ncbi:hypothetical protein Tco_0811132 [Tanacetum coccineum]
MDSAWFTPLRVESFNPFADSDEILPRHPIGMSRVAADPDSDDEVLAEIIFRGQSISGHGVVVVDKLPDDEIVDPRVKVETVSAYASSPPRSESESDDDMENYIPPLPYGAFKDWEIVFRLNPDVDVGLDLLLGCQTVVSVPIQISDDVEDFFIGRKKNPTKIMDCEQLEVVSQELCSCPGLNEWENCVYVCGQGLSYPGNTAGTYVRPQHKAHIPPSSQYGNVVLFASCVYFELLLLQPLAIGKIYLETWRCSHLLIALSPFLADSGQVSFPADNVP